MDVDHRLLLEQEEEEQMNASPRGWLGGQQLSVCDGPLQLHHGDGDASQKLVAR